MFSNFFNTYESVDPPPVKKVDIKNKLKLNQKSYADLVNPFYLGTLQDLLYSRPSQKTSTVEDPITDEPTTEYAIRPYNQEVRQVEDIYKVNKFNYTPKDESSDNQNIDKTSFSSHKDFAKTLVEGYKRALTKNNLDPDYAYVLTAQAAMESGWGDHQSGKFNFGGIKAGKDAPGTYKKTREIDSQGNYYTTTAKFRDFKSIEDYCDYRIKLLGNNRYNIFNQFKPNQSYDIVFHMLKKGYGSDRGGSKSVRYAKSVQTIYNSIIKMTS